ncbi:MAG: rhodanese-related sulfurtransferase, partial [Candidatus Babeliales bacterium]
NGTLGGTTENTELYKKIMHKDPLFADMVFKESPGSADCFPKMRILVKDEAVHLGLDPKTITADNGGIHLEPAQAHQMMAEKTPNLVILDARNNFESRIGTFTNAITPDIDHFRELPTYIDNNLEQFKDKEVLMFCTGGIRCERASSYLKSKGVASNVYQINGGIHTYVEQFPNGFFRGKNYVFDGRVAVKVNDDILGTCYICNTPCDDYTNCVNALCNKHFIGCAACITTLHNACSTQCLELVTQEKVAKRPERVTVKSQEIQSPPYAYPGLQTRQATAGSKTCVEDKQSHE